MNSHCIRRKERGESRSRPTLACRAIALAEKLTPAQESRLAGFCGVAAESTRRWCVGPGQDGETFVVPACDHQGIVTGLMNIDLAGSSEVIEGSGGLVLPFPLDLNGWTKWVAGETLTVAVGPLATIRASEMPHVVGLSGIRDASELLAFLRRAKPASVVIVAEPDLAAQQAAGALRCILVAHDWPLVAGEAGK